MKVILDFLKYNNAVPIILAVMILGTGAAFAANPELRGSVFPSATTGKPLPPKPTDTTTLEAKNLEDFDLDVRIDSITEDGATYFVSYSYTTLEVQGGAWKELRKGAKMEIPKALLGKRDLKTYLVEQIGQVIDRELAYLSEAQVTLVAGQAKNASKYAALVGEEIDERDRKEAERANVSGKGVNEPISESGEGNGIASGSLIGLSKEEINEMIVKAVSDFLAVDLSMPEPLVIPEDETAEEDAETVSGTTVEQEPETHSDGQDPGA